MLVALGTIAGVTSGLWARWTAQPKQQVAAVNALPNATVVPLDPSLPVTAKPEPPATMSSHWLIGGLGFILLWLLSGCGPQLAAGEALGGLKSKMPTAIEMAEDALAIAKETLDDAEIVFDGYKILPVCGSAGNPVLCQDLNAVQGITANLKTLREAVDVLTKGVAALKAGQDSTVNVPKLVATAVKAVLAVNSAVARLRQAGLIGEATPAYTFGA